MYALTIDDELDWIEVDSIQSILHIAELVVVVVVLRNGK